MRDSRDVQESIFILVLFVDGAHQSGGRWQDLIDKDEDGLFGRQLDAFADDIDELADGEVGWHEVLLLVDGRDVRLLDFFADDLVAREVSRSAERILERLVEGEVVTYGNAVSIFRSNALCFCLALLERVLVLKLGTHIDKGVWVSWLGLRVSSWLCAKLGR